MTLESQLTFTCSKPTIEALEKGWKNVEYLLLTDYKKALQYC